MCRSLVTVLLDRFLASKSLRQVSSDLHVHRYLHMSTGLYSKEKFCALGLLIP